VKAEIHPKKLEIPERKYPYLGDYRCGGIIKVVLFTKLNTGMVVWSSDELTGYYSGSWYEHNFEVFDQAVTLSN